MEASRRVLDAPETLNNQLTDCEPTPDTAITNLVFELCILLIDFSNVEFIYPVYPT